MRLYIGEDVVYLTEEELDSLYIDEGKEAIVYKLGSEALKVYRPFCSKNRLDESSAEVLSEYSALMKRILLPKRLVYDDEYNFCGYTTDFIYRISSEDLPKIKMEKFLEEMRLLRDDIVLLGENDILVDDLFIGNTVYNGKIYLIDPGSYHKVYDKGRTSVALTNLDMLNELIINDFFGMISMTKKDKDNLKDIFADSITSCGYVGDFISKTSYSGETMKQYVRRMIR